MTKESIYVVAGFLIIAGLALQLFVSWRRHQRDHREELGPILAAHGLQYVSARWPGFFKTGPFPTFEVEVGRPQSRMAGIRGEYSEYRIVTCRDRGGRTYDIWADLEFETFRLRRVRWCAERDQNLPESAQALLES